MSSAPFCGRRDELGRLATTWRSVTQGAGPAIEVLLGEPGVGKTRLVHGLYAHLAATYQREGDASTTSTRYWPDTLPMEGTNLPVNPATDQVNASATLRFLWWAIRLQAPHARNVVGAGAIGRDVTHLEAHLAAMERARRVDRFWLDVAGAVGRAAMTAIPVAGVASDVAERSFALLQRVRQLQDDRRVRSAGEDERTLRASLNERIVDDLETVLRPRAGRAPVPMVWIVDDAHFSPSDPSVADLFETLQRRAYAQAWPLLTIVTHWPEPWHLQREEGTDDSVAVRMRRIEPLVGDDWNPIDVAPLAADELAPVLRSSLPGLTPLQASALLARAGGQPLFLEEVIRYCADNPKHFEGRDVAAAFKDGHLERVLQATTSVHETVRRRLATAPDDVATVVTLASAQGMQVLRGVTRTLLQQLEEDLPGGTPMANEATFDRADTPYAFLQRLGDDVAAYRLPAYHEVARDNVENLLDPEDLEAPLRQAIRVELERGEEAHEPQAWETLLALAGDRLADADDPDVRREALHALLTLHQRERDRFSYATAGRLAERVMNGMTDGAWTFDDLSLDALDTLTETLLDMKRHALARDCAAALASRATEPGAIARAARLEGVALVALGELDEASERYQKALRAASNDLDRGATIHRRRAMGLALNRLAELDTLRGSLANALQRYEEALATFEQVAADHPSLTARRDVISTRSAIAALQRRLGALDDALAGYLAALSDAERLDAEASTAETRNDVALVRVHVADVQADMGRSREAEEAYRHALAAFEQIADVLGTPESRRSVSVTLHRLAGMHGAAGHADAALASYQDALAIDEPLHRETGATDSLRDAAFAHERIGDLHHARGATDLALAAYGEALERIERVAERLDTPDTQREVTFTLQRIAAVHADAGRSDEALHRYQDLVARRQALVDRSDDPTFVSDLASGQYYLGDLLAASGRSEEALEWMERASAAYDATLARIDTPTHRRDAFVARYRLARLHAENGDLEASLATYVRACEDAERLHDRWPTRATLRDAAVARNRVADAEAAVGADEASLATYHAAIDVLASLFEDDDTDVQAANDLLIALTSGVTLALGMGRLREAHAWATLALNVSARTSSVRPTPEAAHTMAYTQVLLARVEQRRGNADAAMALLREAVPAQRLVNDPDLATSLRTWGLAAFDAGAFREAIAAHEEEVQVRGATDTRWALPETEALLARARVASGAWERGRADGDRAVTAARSSANADLIMRVLVLHGDILHRCGAPSDAIDVLAEARSLAETAGDTQAAFEASAHSVAAYLAHGDVTSALDAARSLLATRDDDAARGRAWRVMASVTRRIEPASQTACALAAAYGFLRDAGHVAVDAVLDETCSWRSEHSVDGEAMAAWLEELPTSLAVLAGTAVGIDGDLVHDFVSALGTCDGDDVQAGTGNAPGS